MNNELLQAILTILTAVLTAGAAYLTAWIRKKNLWTDREAKRRDLELLEAVATIAVEAAEQIGRHRGFNGQAKYDIAVTRASELAGRYGADWSKDEIDAAIHQVVNAMKSEYGKFKASERPVSSDRDPTWAASHVRGRPIVDGQPDASEGRF